MTAITLNLLAEAQLAQEARARDPVKLFIAVGVGLLAAVVAWGAVLSAILLHQRSDLTGLQSKLDKMNGGDAQETDFQKLNKLAEEIAAVNHSRILIAPQLALVKDLVVPSVQLTEVDFALSMDSPGPDLAAEDGGEAPLKGRPKKVQRLVLRLDGKAFDSQPELEVDRFLKLLRDDARFGQLIEDIQLRSIGRVKETDKAGNSREAASFSIECWYKEKATK